MVVKEVSSSRRVISLIPLRGSSILEEGHHSSTSTRHNREDKIQTIKPSYYSSNKILLHSFNVRYNRRLELLVSPPLPTSRVDWEQVRLSHSSKVTNSN